MKIKLILTGKTHESYVKEGILYYVKKLQHYCPFELIETVELKNTKNLDQESVRSKEGENILAHIKAGDWVVLLDDKGKEYSSLAFSQQIEKKQLQRIKNLIFVVGGAYGFSKPLYTRCDEQLSLSKMTFSHQIIRIIFLEQLYRAYSILHNEPYHHE
jgi:23S rRNA (pseudouridine1915-N3)-methyltransferase